jgi:hypothetical protein
VGQYGGSYAFSAAKESASLAVMAINDRPVMQFSSDVGYRRDKPAIVLAPYARVYDVDSPNFGGGQLRIHIATGADVSNRLAIAGGFVVDGGGNVSRSGMRIGTLNKNGGFGTEDLVVSFNANATQAIVKELVRSITFKTVRGSSGARQAVFSLTDGDGGTSQQIAKTIDVM